MPSGIHWIAGGAGAALLLPCLVIGIEMPFWIAGAISVAAGGGVVALLAPRQRFEHLEDSGLAQAKIEFARELLTDAEPLVTRLEAAMKMVRAPGIADRVRHLAAVSRDIIAAIEQDPSRLDRVRRYLTYYLPRAAEIVEAFGTLERSSVPDQPRIQATGELIDRLDVAFTHYAASLQDAELAKLDIELRLLKSSLDDDLGPRPAGASGASSHPANRRA